MKRTNKTFEQLIHTAPDAADIDIINSISNQTLTNDDVYCFKLRLCDTLLDRVADRMTLKFLTEFADKVNEKSVPLLKDHDWSAEKQLGRIYKACVKKDDNDIDYVEAWAYVLNTSSDIDKIKAGILKEVSVSFDCLSICSVCGQDMTKDFDGHGICANKHVAGEEYSDGKCESILTSCIDVFEVSFVAVPCQPNAAVIKGLTQSGQADSVTNTTNINNGGKTMKKKFLALKKLAARNKSAETPDEQLAELVDILTSDGDDELTAEEIENLCDENENLKKRIAELEDKVKQLEDELNDARQQADEAIIETTVEDRVEKLCPNHPVIKENMLRDIDRTALKVEDGKVTGLDEAIEAISKKYDGLYGKKISTKKDSKDMPGNSTSTVAKSAAVKKNGMKIN